MKIINRILNFFRKSKKTNKNIQNKLILRLTEDKKSSYYVYDNQIESALNIIDNFKSGNRWCLLMAQMQSGKSGTFFSVPYIISRNENIRKNLNIDYKNEINMFLLTPMSDTELVKQFEQDIVSFTGADLRRNVIHNNEMQKFLKTKENDWRITDKETIEKMKHNSIILIDESHYGSNNTQVLNTFLKNILGINANGDNKALINKNMYILSISATPMAERISIDNKNIKKTLIPLNTTKEYFGIIGMWENNKIKQSFDLNNNDEINKFINHIENINTDGYVFVRANNSGKKTIDDIIAKMPTYIECINYNQETKKSIFSDTDINDILSLKPNCKKIIFFKGKLRAGQRVNTENVIMVHDTAKSNPDTTVQSFLGRCCGYNKNKDVEIFCDLKSAKAYYDWVKSGFSKLSTPKSKNVIKKHAGIRVEKTIKTPVIQKIKDEDIISLLCNKHKPNNVKIKIIKHINNINLNNILNSKKFIIGPIYVVSEDNKNSTYKKHFVDKKNGMFLSARAQPYNTNDIGLNIISATFNKTTNEIVVLTGKVVNKIPGPELSDDSMYSNKNK